MPGPSPNSQIDGISTITKGMNCGVAPRLIPVNQVAMAINVTFRNGLPRTRPVWKKVPLTYDNEALHSNATEKLFQCASGYQAYGAGENCLVASIGGHLFRYLVGTSNAVQDISISNTTTVGGGGFVVPAINATVSVTFASTVGWSVGINIVIAGINFTVQSITSTTVAVLVNVDGTAGTVIAAAEVATAYIDANSSQNPDCWMWQAEDFLIVNNGQTNPLFFDGAKTRRSAGDGGNELPPGCMGAYVQGRVWMVLPNSNQKPSQEFMAGDLVYSHGFQDGYNGRSAVLRTEENAFFSGGGAFSVPVEAGPITAMSSVAIADTSLGQGPLQVMTAGSVFSVSVPFAREEWAATNYPLMTIGLPGYGALSQLSVVRVNGDLWYRSVDGLRSYQVGRRDLNTWVHTPLSVEVEKILALDAANMLNKANGILFNNRLLESCSPFQTGRGTAHRGLTALDFNGISTLTSRSDPAYDGLWTGLSILQLVKGTFNGIERCFAFALDNCQRICLYELLNDNDGWFDYDGSDNVPVLCAFESRSMGWKDNGNTLKRLQCADVYLDRLAGVPMTEFDFWYRSDEDPTWIAWHAFNLCAPVEDCTTADCPTFDNVREQYRTFLRLPEPQDTCSQITKRMSRTGYEFQLRMQWRGFAQLNRVHVWSEALKDSVVQVCPTSETCTLLKGCDLPWFEYQIETATCTDTIPDTLYATPPPVPGKPAPTPTPTPQPEPEPPEKDAGPNGVPDDDWHSPDPNYWLPPTIEQWTERMGCAPANLQYSNSLQVYDPAHGVANIVGISPADGVNPATYIDDAAVSVWSADVWAQWYNDKAAQGITTSQEYIGWLYALDTGDNWSAVQVYPNKAGGYNAVIHQNLKLVIYFCRTN